MFKTKKQLRKELEEIKSDLKSQVSSLKESNEFLREENERLKKQLSGEHVCTGYCQGCEHGIRLDSCAIAFGIAPKYICALDCKCENFVEKMS